MDRTLYGSALLLGALAVVWTASIFMVTDALAFVITLVIGGVYAIGTVELLKFDQATATLSRALNVTHEKIDNFNDWLDQLDPSLRNAVRLRVEGQQAGLPAPVLTPYLVGLLVMLGLLGTFVGMVDTLRGAVAALEGSTDLQAIRQGLAAPINGLGMAFGTSVAGVATSAMLGLMSTLSRRRRMLETRRLGTCIPTCFQDFSLVYNQRQTFRSLQRQTQSLPVVAGMLETVAGKLDHLGDVLISNQERFHQSVADQYTQLADSVDQALKENLAANVRLVGETVNPVADAVMRTVTQETQSVHHRLTQISQQTLDEFGKTLTRQSQDYAASWEGMVNAHQQANDVLISRVGTTLDRFAKQYDRMLTSMLEAFNASAKGWLERQEANDQVRINRWRESIDTLQQQAATHLTDMSAAVASELEQLQSALASHVSTLGQTLEAPMNRLIETASEAPRAAADLVQQMHRETAKQAHRGNRLLDERRRVTEQLDILCASLNDTLGGQRGAIEQLVASSQAMMEAMGHQFADQMDRDMSTMSTAADTVAVSAVEMASLSESFAKSVELFNKSNSDLVENLARMEDALEKTITRSDDQLGYFVAQAREIIEYSMLSQKEIVDEWRALQPRHDMDLEAN